MTDQLPDEPEQIERGAAPQRYRSVPSKKALRHMTQPIRAALAAGGVVLLPTDTVYGIAADARDEAAVGKLRDVKQRTTDQPIAIIFKSVEQLYNELPDLSPRARAAIDELLPGPYTLLVRNPGGHFAWLCGEDASIIGVRVPFGAYDLPPLAATSANAPGQPEAIQMSQLPEPIVDAIDAALDVGPIRGASSTILDLTAWEDDESQLAFDVGRIIRDPRNLGHRALMLLDQPTSHGARFRHDVAMLKSCAPGRRFRDRQERRQHATFLSRVATIALGGLLVALGFAMMVLPGPGVISVFVGLGMFAGESRLIASWLDRLEVPLNRVYRVLRDRLGDGWLARVVALIVLLIGGAVTLWVSLTLTRLVQSHVGWI